MNKYLLLFLIVAFPFVIAQKSQLGGLSFNSQNILNEKKTSLNLTADKKIFIDKSLTLRFDISLEQNSDYGFVLRIKTDSLKIKLLYVPYQNKDTSYLKLAINNEAINDKISLPKNELTRGNWYEANLVLDRLNSQCTLSVNNKQQIKSKLRFRDSDNNLNIVFGIEKFDGHPNGEVPGMSIRNIEILGNENKPIHFWPLNETSGLIARDVISNLSAKVVNPNWMINNHYKLKNVAKVGPFPKVFPVEALPVIYRTSKKQILIVAKDFCYSYDINTGTIKKEIFTVPLLHKDNVVVYDEKLDRLYAYYRGMGKVSTYDKKSKRWSAVDTTGEHDANFYFHNSFVNPLNNDLCMINGYGWYTFKNYLQKYDFVNMKWERVKTKGDFLVPRLAAAIGKKNNQGDFFIFGGFGNKSGKQEDGINTLKDLYLLRMKDTSVHKIGELQNIPYNLNAYPTMYFDSTQNQLYIIGNEKYGIKKSFKRIYRYDLTKNIFEPVSDSLNCGDVINTPIIYDEQNKEFFAFERIDASPDSFYLNINSLLYPPLTEKEFEKLDKQEASTNLFALDNKLLVIMFVIIAGAGFVFYLIRKKFKKLPEEMAGENNLVTKKQLNINSIYLFGDFQVFDKFGKNISKLFTPKIKQLFLLLIVKSYNGSNRGISTESLTAFIWPELGADQTKNNRNVTISKLRKILSGLDGIEIIKEKNIWEISIGEKVFCDYKVFKNIIGSDDFDIEKINALKNILARGELLKETSYEWFDGIKTNSTEEAVLKLKMIASKNNVDNKSKLSIADSILFLDSVNEDGLALKLKSLIEMGDHNLAVSAFNTFKKEYFRLYAEEYPKSFSDF